MTMLWGTVAQASNVGVNLNLNVGNPPAVVVPAPPPVYVAPQPVYVAPQPRTVVIDDVQEPPEFIYPQNLGFYVAVGVPYDMFYVDNSYYVYRNNSWYRGPHFDGPWREVRHRYLPPGLRRHNFERIRYYRDEEYRHYRDDRERYHGRRFRPEKEWKEHRKEEKREWKEEKRRDKEERKGRGHDRDD
jgi:hypothetical protein